MADLGVGKSTIGAYLFSKFKMSPNFTVELINEYAKDCVYENRLNVIKDDQLYIFAKQNHKLVAIKNYEKSPDFVISDSPLLLSNIYGEINNSVSELFKSFVLETFKSYENLNFFIERNKNIKYEVNGRLQTIEEAIKIDNKIKDYLIKNNINFEIIKNENLKLIFEKIIDYFKK